ncbi:MAG: 6-carboxytetrahydropterin synthase [Gammaproteobacteria bacterium]|nr:6-carboxytetrahydropterin synthase [Gammaproteobacteria bacterium]
MSRLAIVKLHKEGLKFSAGHFMLLSGTHRESLHGHDYQVSVTFHTLIKKNGMSFDCRVYKQKVLEICQQLDYRFILPGESEYLRLEDAGDKWIAHLELESLTFSKNDAVVLPICNATLEELSHWIVQQLSLNAAALAEDNIQGMIVEVYNGRAESAATCWGTCC